eukprot:TRINITY_DN5048_c0_g1_i1.p1 TRINITY_DN5048_c0_g1~~TRINITY_DN5048_c0_g1_i1.p1  ORF type:complete len:501 (+),score=95.10 TRINITY_DN5048_c0_g1_i1:101-1603(+)
MKQTKNIDVSIAIGDYGETDELSSNFQLKKLSSPSYEESVDHIKKITGESPEDNLFFRLCLSVKEGVNAFNLGGVVGKIKALVTLVKTSIGDDIIKFFAVKMEPRDESSDKKDLVIYLVIPNVDREFIFLLKNFEEYGFSEISAELLSDTPLPDQDNVLPLDFYLPSEGVPAEFEDECFPIKLKLSGTCDATMFNEAHRQNPFLPSPFDFGAVMVNHVKINLNFDSFEEAKENNVLDFDLGWKQIRRILLSLFYKYMSDLVFDDGPIKSLFKDIYTGFTQYLSGIPLVEAQLENYHSKLSTNGLNFFDGFLPSYEELMEHKTTFPTDINGISLSEKRVLILGLDASGKTTILYRLKLAETVSTIPTIGFNVESVTHNNINFTMWDVGGSQNIRVLWRHYYDNTHGIIWVVDAHDRDRLNQSVEYFKETLRSDDLDPQIPVLIFINKQDLPDSITVSHASELFSLNVPEMKNRPWYIQSSCAVSGEGLWEGLTWISQQLNQ